MLLIWNMLGLFGCYFQNGHNGLAEYIGIQSIRPVKRLLFDQGPVSLTEISFHSHLDSNTAIATKLCTWLCCRGMCKNLLRSDGQQQNHVCFMRPDFPKPNLVSRNKRAYRWQFVYSYVVSGSRFKIQIYFPTYQTGPMVLFGKLFTSIKIKWIKMKFNVFASAMPYVLSIVVNTCIIRVRHGL